MTAVISIHLFLSEGSLCEIGWNWREHRYPGLISCPQTPHFQVSGSQLWLTGSKMDFVMKCPHAQVRPVQRSGAVDCWKIRTGTWEKEWPPQRELMGEEERESMSLFVCVRLPMRRRTENGSVLTNRRVYEWTQTHTHASTHTHTVQMLSLKRN